jgi:hypothetical protein
MSLSGLRASTVALALTLVTSADHVISADQRVAAYESRLAYTMFDDQFLNGTELFGIAPIGKEQPVIGYPWRSRCGSPSRAARRVVGSAPRHLHTTHHPEETAGNPL